MTQGPKQDLREMGGSFANRDQQKALDEAVSNRHESFNDVVQRQTQQAAPRTRKMQDISEPQSGGVSLTQDEITGGIAPEQREVRPPIQEQGQEEDYKIENEFGDEVCKFCGSILESSKPDGIIDISDDELTTYMFGGRVIRTFAVGNVEFEIQSLLQNEVDDVTYRTGQDAENGQVSLDSDYRTRHSFYRLVYALLTLQNEKLVPDPGKNAGPGDVDAWFVKKYNILSTYAHQFIVLISEKQAILENSLNFAINDKVRVKN